VLDRSVGALQQRPIDDHGWCRAGHPTRSKPVKSESSVVAASSARLRRSARAVLIQRRAQNVENAH